MVDFIPGMALLHLTKGAESLGSTAAHRTTNGRIPPGPSRRRVPASMGNGRASGSGRDPRDDAGRPAANTAPATSDPRAPSPEPRAGEDSEPITCGFCGKPFVEDRSQATCQACPLSKGCGLMRCPHCGYENAKEPGWLSRIKEWIG